MPKESENTEEKELSEQELADEEAAFDGKELSPDDKDEKGGDEKPEEKPEGKEEKPAVEVKEEEKEEKAEAEEKETKPEEEKEEESAVEAAEQRAQELFGDEEETEEKPPAKETDLDVKKLELTKEEAAEYLKMFPVEELPDEIYIGNRVFNLKELATHEDTEDIFNAMAVVSGHVAEKAVAKALEKSGYVKQETLDEMQAELDAERAYGNYMAAVQEVHPDVRKLDRSKGFGEWLEKQNPAMKKLVGSPDPDHGIMAINAYKESIAKEKAAEHDETASAKKKRKDDLHKHSARTKEEKRGAEELGDMDDEKAGWDEEGKKK